MTRISVVEAAKEFDIQPCELRQRMIDGRLNIGHIKKSEKRYTFYIYKELIEECQKEMLRRARSYEEA